jgi:hypothetical protein
MTTKEGTMATQRFEFEVTSRTTAYVKLPHWDDVQRTGTLTLRNMTLRDIIGAYKGPYVVFDFDKATGVLVGIEVITDDEEDEDVEDVEGAAQKTLKLSGQTPAYLKLPTYSSDVEQTREVTLSNFVQGYKGPEVKFDFDEQSGVLVGIKVIAEDQ